MSKNALKEQVRPDARNFFRIAIKNSSKENGYLAGSQNSNFVYEFCGQKFISRPAAFVGGNTIASVTNNNFECLFYGYLPRLIYQLCSFNPILPGVFGQRIL